MNHRVGVLENLHLDTLGQLHPGFDDQLRELRIAFGHPMFPRSCCRSAAHNRAEKGHRRSLHVYDQPYHFKRGQRGTLAIDVAIPRGELSVLLLETALALGWSVGVSKTFFHLDRRELIGLEPRVFGYGGN